MLNIWTAKGRSFTCCSIVELEDIFANTDISTDIESYSNSETNCGSRGVPNLLSFLNFNFGVKS